jgi:trehalose 6-phosphate synthase complex regulatory subunit
LIQVATSTTEQAELDATVSDIVTRVNSRNSSLTAQPLVFLKQDISYAQYLALLTVADSLMITSLREGMNLTSHEFIACQDGQYTENKHGPLILSEFTGSSTVFGGSELPVNPWDYRQCAEQIHNALTMKPEEREKRWTSLNNVVTHHTAAHWFKTFTDKLSTVWTQQQERGGISVPRLSIPELGKRYKNSEKRLFILDYEGTLAPWGSPDSIILTSPQRVLDTLNELILDERNVVYVMSGRSPQELEPLFSRVPNLGLIAENGCFVRDYGSSEWNLDNIDGMKGWMKSYKGILEYWVERTPGSSIECRHCSLIFHFDQAEDPEGAARQAGECVSHINESGEDQRVHAIPIDGAVIVESMDWTKATAAAQILDRMKQEGSPDFLMVAGDDREDEPIFRWANALGKDGTVKFVNTVSIGSRSTEAMSTLSQGVTGNIFLSNLT